MKMIMARPFMKPIKPVSGMRRTTFARRSQAISICIAPQMNMVMYRTLRRSAMVLSFRGPSSAVSFVTTTARAPAAPEKYGAHSNVSFYDSISTAPA